MSLEQYVPVREVLDAFAVRREDDNARLYVVHGIGVVDAAPFEVLFRKKMNAEAVPAARVPPQPAKAAAATPPPPKPKPAAAPKPSAAKPPAPDAPAGDTRSKRIKDLRERKYTYVSEAIRAVVTALGPIPADEVYDEVVELGFPSAAEQSVRQMLYQMWQRDEITRGEDKRYSALPPSAEAAHA